jgi:DNA transformation protein
LTADDLRHIAELFGSFGPVNVRRMFGGASIYADGVMFALSYDGLVYLKADAATAPSFEREGSGPFVFTGKNGKRATMSYWRLPDRLYDDPDELATWAKAALATALRAQKRSESSIRARDHALIRRPASRRRRSLPDRSRK